MDDQEGHERAPGRGGGMRVCGNAPCLVWAPAVGTAERRAGMMTRKGTGRAPGRGGDGVGVERTGCLILGTYTHTHAGIKLPIERRLHLIVCKLNYLKRQTAPK